MNERELFLSALEIEDPAARQAHLEAACADDVALLARVEALLASHESQSRFLNTPVVEQIRDDSAGRTDTAILLGNGSTQDEEPDAETPGSNGLQPVPENGEGLSDEMPLEYLQPTSRPDSIGRLAHYEVLEVVGRGAFGTVLRAFDEKLRRVVAIKVLSPEMAATSPARKRFLREARSSAAVRHKNVVSIYAVEDDPIPYLVMDYIPGQTLQQRLDEHGPLDLPDVLRLGKQIADGLAAAHAEGLIHRDIKPGNILLETSLGNHVKITDFGLARAADDASMTRSGVIAGTPMYMAPEQALGRKLDQRADLFSFGSVLYQMLCGHPPFRAPTTMAVLKRVAQDTPRPIQEIIPEVPDWMCQLVGHLLAKNPDERYGTAQEVSDLLAQCLADVQAGRKPTIPAPSPPADDAAGKQSEKVRLRGFRRIFQRPLAAVAAVALLLMVGLGITEATGITQLIARNGATVGPMNVEPTAATASSAVTNPPRLEGESFALTPRQAVMGSLVSYYRPIRVALGPRPQETLVAEPAYVSDKPLYGTLTLGSGNDRLVTLVLDEPEGDPPRIYIDRNNDEDLTNDGAGDWDGASSTALRLSGVTIDVDYENGSLPYTFQFYRFKDRLQDFVLYYRDAGRVGEIASGGRQYKIAVLDENADGRFDDLENGALLIDLNQDGRLVGSSDSAELHELAKPFNIRGKVWQVASLSPDGTRLQLQPSSAEVAMKAYLEPGYPAPAFTGKDLDGNPVDLTQEAAGAKYILLDFWASWCPPCHGEFPYLRRLHARYKDHGLKIVGINLDSDRGAAVRATEENGLTYPHVFDGQGWKNAVAVLYRVDGIPETYLLDQHLNILVKGLRGATLEARLAEVLGPGDEQAAEAVEAAIAKRRSLTGPVASAPRPSETELSDQVLPVADDAELADAVIALYASPKFLGATKSLADVFEKGGEPMPVARAATPEAALASQADIVVLLLGRRLPGPQVPEELLTKLKDRKVIGIGEGAAQLFGMLGLEINSRACAHGVRFPAQITPQDSQLIGKSDDQGTEPITAFVRNPASESAGNFAMYVPAKSELCTVVDVLARWTTAGDYAPVVRQGNHVMVGITAPPSTWTPEFTTWFRQVVAVLHARDKTPFATAQLKTTEPGSYEFTLARSGQTDELSGKTFYFKFARPGVFSARLEHAGSDAVMLMFMGDGRGDNLLHRTRRDARTGEPLNVDCRITETDLQNVGNGYWKLGVTNFDRANRAECTLSIKYE